MDINSVGELLTRISVHYPTFKRHVMDRDGNISKYVMDEWQRRLWYMDLDTAREKLDAYLDEGHDKAPDTEYFRGDKKKPEYFMSGRKIIYSVDQHGNLIDDKGQLYGYPDNPDGVYHYDSNGHIVDDRGRLIQ